MAKSLSEAYSDLAETLKGLRRDFCFLSVGSLFLVVLGLISHYPNWFYTVAVALLAICVVMAFWMHLGYKNVLMLSELQKSRQPSIDLLQELINEIQEMTK